MGLAHPKELIRKLNLFVDELYKWNKTYNLTAIRDKQKIVTLHLLDSLVIQQFVKSDSVIDIGSGAGFPGIPLALYFPQKQFTLLDSNGKKTRFLQQMKIQLGLDNCEIVQSRVEEYKHQFDLVTCRAFASLTEIKDKAAHLVANNGQILALKAQLKEVEIQSDLGPFKISAIHKLIVPGVEAERNLVIMERFSETV